MQRLSVFIRFEGRIALRIQPSLNSNNRITVNREGVNKIPLEQFYQLAVCYILIILGEREKGYRSNHDSYYKNEQQNAPKIYLH